MPTRFVVPFEPYNGALFIDDWLNPAMDVRGRRLLMVTQLAGTIPARSLGVWRYSFQYGQSRASIQRALHLMSEI